MTPSDSAAAAFVEAAATSSDPLRDLLVEELELGTRVAQSFAQVTPAA